MPSGKVILDVTNISNRVSTMVTWSKMAESMLRPSVALSLARSPNQPHRCDKPTGYMRHPKDLKATLLQVPTQGPPVISVSVPKYLISRTPEPRVGRHVDNQTTVPTKIRAASSIIGNGSD